MTLEVLPMSTRLIAPARPGLQVRQPSGAVLAAAGETVEWSAFWERRFVDGDVVVLEPPTPAPKLRAPAADKEA